MFSMDQASLDNGYFNTGTCERLDSVLLLDDQKYPTDFQRINFNAQCRAKMVAAGQTDVLACGNPSECSFYDAGFCLATQTWQNNPNEVSSTHEWLDSVTTGVSSGNPWNLFP